MTPDEMRLLAHVMEKEASILGHIGKGFSGLSRGAKSVGRAWRGAGKQPGATIGDQFSAAKKTLGRRLDRASGKDVLQTAGALGTAGLAGYGTKKMLLD